MKYWIWLSQVPYIGPVSAGKLIQALKSPEAVYYATKEALSLVPGLTARQISNILGYRSLDHAIEILEDCEKKQISLLTISDPAYPNCARECDDAPILLYYKGKFQKIERSVGIVGARRCTQEVKNQVAEITNFYVKTKTAIISGMAKGVDSYAHTACLKAHGYTIAIVANGLDICYPSEHKKLKECIEKQGLILSEYPPGTKPQKYYFPRRNRLISAWSDELLVVSAGKGSGALITAEYAEKYGRNIMLI